MDNQLAEKLYLATLEKQYLHNWTDIHRGQKFMNQCKQLIKDNPDLDFDKLVSSAHFLLKTTLSTAP
ncbi:MAG: hypothetical protein WC716_02380 [Chitinophagaceae bacterium]|jgi:hypothetical protein